MKHLILAALLVAPISAQARYVPTQLDEWLPPCRLGDSWHTLPTMRDWIETRGFPRFMIENSHEMDAPLLNIVWPNGLIYLRVDRKQAAYLVCESDSVP